MNLKKIIISKLLGKNLDKKNKTKKLESSTDHSDLEKPTPKLGPRQDFAQGGSEGGIEL